MHRNDSEQEPLTAPTSYQHDDGHTSSSNAGGNSRSFLKACAAALAVAMLMGAAFIGGERSATTRLREEDYSREEVFDEDVPLLGAGLPDCWSDRDCTDPPPPGELPKKYCYYHYCRAWKNGVGVPEDGYPVWIPTDEEGGWYSLLKMPRTILEEGPVMEQVWHFDLNDQPGDIEVTFNGTHVEIPLHQQMLAGYSRTYHQFDEHEAGIITAAFLPNPVSVVTDKPNSGMIEKYHTLTYHGKWSEVRTNRIRSLGASQNAGLEDWDYLKYRGRGDLMATVFGLQQTVSAQVEGGIDKAHLLKIRLSGADPATTTADPASPGWQYHSGIASEQPSEAKTKNSLKSENHCKHFEDGWGVSFTDTHIIMPVRSPIVMLSGEMVYSPTYYLGFNGGFTVVDYDPNTNILEMYYQGFQSSRQYTDPKIPADEWPYPSGIWVSQPGPNYPVSETDGRQADYLKKKKPLAGALVKAMHDIPVDYSLYTRPKDEVCPQSYEDNLDWASVELPAGDGNLWEQFLQSANLIHVANDGAPCGADYMRPDFAPDTSGYEINEFGVWNHLLLEVLPDHTKQIATADWWNDWSDFYKQK